MKAKFIKPLIVIVIIAAFAGGGAWLWQSRMQSSAPTELAAQPEIPETLDQDEAKRRFDEVITAFKQDVQSEMMTYKRLRQTLSKMVLPVSIVSSDYAAENHRMALELSADIRRQSGKVLQSFVTADKQINALLVYLPEDKAAEVTQRWQALKEKTAGAYQAFFAMDEDVLKAYEDLTGFYARNSGAFEVDTQANEIVFDSPETRAEADALKAKIRELLLRQAEVMQKTD